MIKMIAGNMSRKRSVLEAIQMHNQIDEGKLRLEMTRLVRKQSALDKVQRVVKADEARLSFCDSFNARR